MRFTPSEKMEIIRLVEGSELSVNKTLKELGIHKSTFYNWYNRYLQDGPSGLNPKKPNRKDFWNKIPEEVKSKVIDLALDLPDLSPRELSCEMTDNHRYFISESSVYRILKRAGLITSPAFILLQASDKFKKPTYRINEMWQTDFTYFKIIGWGWYYLSTIMDDYSRYILSWELCDTMKAKDVKETIEKAFRKVNISSSAPPKILSDNGPCYVGNELAEYFDKMNMKHVRGRPFHPQTQGKIERYHRTLKNVIKLDNYYTPGELKYRLSKFIDYYNHKRFHESLNNLTPADIYFGRRANKLMRREIIKRETIKKRRINYQLLTNKV
jgi:transposase InsO family protein